MEPDLDAMRTDTLRASLEQIRKQHPRTTSSATVYFVRCEDYLKIGTTHGPVSRFSVIQTGNPFEINCVYSFNCIDAYGCEGKIQALFQQHQVRREWFYVTEEQLDTIRSVFNDNVDADPDAIAADDKKFRIQQSGRAFSHLVNTFPHVSDEALSGFLVQTAEEKLEGPERAAVVEVVAEIDSSKKRKHVQKQTKVKAPAAKRIKIAAPKAVGGHTARWQEAHAKLQELTDEEFQSVEVSKEDVCSRGTVALFKHFPDRRAELTAEHSQWYARHRAALFHGYTLTLTPQEIQRLNLANMAFAFRSKALATSASIQTCLEHLKQLLDALAIPWDKFVTIDDNYRLDKATLIKRTQTPLVSELCRKILNIIWVHKDVRRVGSGIALVRRVFAHYGRTIVVPDWRRTPELMHVSVDPAYNFLSDFIRPFITLKD